MDNQLLLAEETCRQLMFALFCKEQLIPERGHVGEVSDIKSAFWSWFAWKRQFYHISSFTEEELDRCFLKQFYQQPTDGQMMNFRLVGSQELAALKQLQKSSIC